MDRSIRIAKNQKQAAARFRGRRTWCPDCGGDCVLIEAVELEACCSGCGAVYVATLGRDRARADRLAIAQLTLLVPPKAVRRG